MCRFEHRALDWLTVYADLQRGLGTQLGSMPMPSTEFQCLDSETPSASLSAGPFRPRPGVVGARSHEAVVLLDRTTGQYLTLNQVAAEIWEQLTTGNTPTAVVDRLCADYDAPRDRIATDVAAQIQELLRRGLIEPGTATEPPPAPSGIPGRALACCFIDSKKALSSPAGPLQMRLPSYLRCALLITHVKLRLARQGYERTLNWVRRKVEQIPATAGVTLEAVRTVEYRVAMAGALYPGRALCLEQSLALYYLLRRQRAAVKYCTGVQPYPFLAHAWVEYHGEPINDVLEHVRCFARLPDELP